MYSSLIVTSKDSVNYLITIETHFYCETKGISFINVTDITQHNLFPPPGITVRDNSVDSQRS